MQPPLSAMRASGGFGRAGPRQFEIQTRASPKPNSPPPEFCQRWNSPEGACRSCDPARFMDTPRTNPMTRTRAHGRCVRLASTGLPPCLQVESHPSLTGSRHRPRTQATMQTTAPVRQGHTAAGFAGCSSIGTTNPFPLHASNPMTHACVLVRKVAIYGREPLEPVAS